LLLLARLSLPHTRSRTPLLLVASDVASHITAFRAFTSLVELCFSLPVCLTTLILSHIHNCKNIFLLGITIRNTHPSIEISMQDM
uniref:Ovule protein n=1 Tax=Ascaris lumbricoides TaxID=6252 RepID=A0A0M3IDZ9_ASCLU